MDYLSDDLINEIRSQIDNFDALTTRELVFAVCDALAWRGLQPGSWPKILRITGRGSATTIQAAKNEWSQRLVASRQKLVDGLPLNPKVQSAAREFFNQFAACLQAEFEKTGAAKLAQLTDDLVASDKQIHDYMVSLSSANEQIASLRSSVDELQEKLTDANTEILRQRSLIASHEELLRVNADHHARSLQDKDQYLQQTEQRLNAAISELVSARQFSLQALDKERAMNKVLSSENTHMVAQTITLREKLDAEVLKTSELSIKVAQLMAQNASLEKDLNRGQTPLNGRSSNIKRKMRPSRIRG